MECLAVMVIAHGADEHATHPVCSSIFFEFALEIWIFVLAFGINDAAMFKVKYVVFEAQAQWDWARNINKEALTYAITWNWLSQLTFENTSLIVNADFSLWASIERE